VRLSVAPRDDLLDAPSFRAHRRELLGGLEGLLGPALRFEVGDPGLEPPGLLEGLGRAQVDGRYDHRRDQDDHRHQRPGAAAARLGLGDRAAGLGAV
jgi:hypothetical protein